MAPSSLRAALAASSTLGQLARSAANPTALAPRAVISPTARSSASCPRATSATATPSAASASATPRPSPLLPPRISAVFPFSWRSIFQFTAPGSLCVLVRARQVVVERHAEAVERPRHEVVLADREDRIHHLLDTVALRQLFPGLVRNDGLF